MVNKYCSRCEVDKSVDKNATHCPTCQTSFSASTSETSKYCSRCRDNKSVNENATHCPTCRTAFNIVVTSSASTSRALSNNIPPASGSVAYGVTKAMVEKANQAGGSVTVDIKSKDTHSTFKYTPSRR